VKWSLSEGLLYEKWSRRVPWKYSRLEWVYRRQSL